MYDVVNGVGGSPCVSSDSTDVNMNSLRCIIDHRNS